MPTTDVARDGAAAVSASPQRPKSTTWGAVGGVRRNGVPIATIVAVLLAWEIVPALLHVPEFVFPRLSVVLSRFTSDTTLTLIVQHAQVTLYEALVGLAIGVVAGVGLGFLLAEFDVARRAVYPFVIAFQSMPKVALAPLFIIWFGFGYTPKVLVVVMLVFFPMLVNTMNGIIATDKARLDLFRSLAATKFQIWTRLQLPSALPYVFAGLEVTVVYSFIGAITGEFVGADAGLGVLLQQFKSDYDTPAVFAILIVLAAIGIILNRIVGFLRRRLVFWQA